jgi:hypothetical protein
MAAELHPDVAALAPLLGTWEGEGSGEYPTIEAFEYRESVTFTHVGKPFLAYAQRTWHPVSGLPMHSETGYVRMPGPGAVEIVLAHPTGLTEVYVGGIVTDDDLLVIDVRSTSIGSTPSAKDVLGTERTFSLSGDELRYTFRMAAVGRALQHHLSAALRRSS